MNNYKSLLFSSLLVGLTIFAYLVSAAEELEVTKKAAEQGYARAQYWLGYMYAYGEGVPEDDAEAYAWYSIAAAQGDEVAKEYKERAAEGMTRAQIAEAQKLSRKYWETYGPNRKPTK